VLSNHEGEAHMLSTQLVASMSIDPPNSRDSTGSSL